jgi:hypothetical protein
MHDGWGTGISPSNCKFMNDLERIGDAQTRHPDPYLTQPQVVDHERFALQDKELVDRSSSGHIGHMYPNFADLFGRDMYRRRSEKPGVKGPVYLAQRRDFHPLFSADNILFSKNRTLNQSIA